MQETQEFYRCLVSDASSRALRQIRDILADGTIVRLLEDLGIDCGDRHDF